VGREAEVTPQEVHTLRPIPPQGSDAVSIFHLLQKELTYFDSRFISLECAVTAPGLTLMTSLCMMEMQSCLYISFLTSNFQLSDLVLFDPSDYVINVKAVQVFLSIVFSGSPQLEI
jgi:hypothetical protein